jgi:hypothetical protein
VQHYHLKSPPSTVDSSRTRFTDELGSLCRKLEQWRGQQKAIVIPDPNEFPKFDWRVGRQSVVFYVLGELVVLAQSWFKFANEDDWTLWLYITLLAICGGAGTVLMVQAQRIFSRQFLRAVRSIFRPTDNYPFTPLMREMDRDLAAAPMLAMYSDALLRAARDRILIEETELRERLTILGGSSPLAFILSVLTGVWAAWQSLQKERSIVTMLLLAAGIGVLCLTFYAVKLRFSLFELTRCRGVLDLELAVREGKEISPTESLRV